MLEVASGLRVPLADVRRTWLVADTRGVPVYELWIAVAQWEEAPVVASEQGVTVERRMGEKPLRVASFPIDRPYAAAVGLARLAELVHGSGKVNQVWRVTPEGPLQVESEASGSGDSS